MAALRAVTFTFTASIDNEQVIHEWLKAVRERAASADRALSDLAETLRSTPHVSIRLDSTGDKS